MNKTHKEEYYINPFRFNNTMEKMPVNIFNGF